LHINYNDKWPFSYGYSPIESDACLKHSLNWAAAWRDSPLRQCYHQCRSDAAQEGWGWGD